MRTTQRKGDIAVAAAISIFTRLGWDVSKPLTESATYDLVVDVDGSLKRVQVKYSSRRDIDLRKIHSNSKGYVTKLNRTGDFDWLVVFHRNEIYLYEGVPEKSSIQISHFRKLEERTIG